jgi:hypothetical protein
MPDGICELRATSKTLRAKSEHCFTRCLAVNVVVFNLLSLMKLFTLAISKSYASQVQTLVFVAPRVGYQYTSCKLQKYTGFFQKVALNSASMLGLPTKQSPKILLMMFAFKRLANLRTVIISKCVQHCYPASVRQSSLAKHPPTMILAASVAGGAQLQHIVMSGRETGTVHGVRPRILNGFLQGNVRPNALKTISLVLTTRNCKFLAAFPCTQILNLYSWAKTFHGLTTSPYRFTSKPRIHVSYH